MDQLDRVLSQLREQYSPDCGAQQRVRVALAASLAASAVVGSASLQAAAAAGSSGAGAAKSVAMGGSLLWAKVVAGVSVVAAVTATGLAVRQSGPSSDERTNGPGQSMTAARAPSTDSNVARQRIAQESAAQETQGPEPAKATADLAAARHTTVDSRRRAPALRSSTMLEEVRLLRDASQKLRTGRSEEAQHILQEHERRFPNSVVSDERRGLLLLADCARAKTASNRIAADRFVRAAPSSPLADSIRRQCLE